MHDCVKTDMKDLLPDLLHDRLLPLVREEVRAHVGVCQDCRAELDLLVRVRAMAAAPSINTSRMAHALPPHRAIPRWQRAARSPSLRVAAAIILVLGISFIGSETFYPEGGSRDTSGTPSRVVTSGPLELPIGDGFGDLTDADLRALLEEMGQIEAVTPQETEVIAPSFVRNGA